MKGLELVVQEVIDGSRGQDDAPGLTQEVIDTINDSAVRREVWVEASEHLDDLTMMEVGYILDALVMVLKGDNDG